MFAAIAEADSATTSLQEREITEHHDSAPYLLISRSIITPNLVPCSMILKVSGLFPGAPSSPTPPHHISNSHAERWPIPPPTIIAFLGFNREHTSLILRLIDLGRGGMSM
ncbi:MAG: hypothetical protein CMA79_01575 [Euryarchaeota archaeon]|nr:hypothetical protein [Euryarchaeota archaeon]